MAQFYAEVQGNRGKATRMGTKDSGMWAHLRGWNLGVRVEIQHINGKDFIRIFRTGGSNNPATIELGTLNEDSTFLMEA